MQIQTGSLTQRQVNSMLMSFIRHEKSELLSCEFKYPFYEVSGKLDGREFSGRILKSLLSADEGSELKKKAYREFEDSVKEFGEMMEDLFKRRPT